MYTTQLTCNDIKGFLSFRLTSGTPAFFLQFTINVDSEYKRGLKRARERELGFWKLAFDFNATQWPRSGTASRSGTDNFRQRNMDNVEIFFYSLIRHLSVIINVFNHIFN